MSTMKRSSALVLPQCTLRSAVSGLTPFGSVSTNTLSAHSTVISACPSSELLSSSSPAPQSTAMSIAMIIAITAPLIGTAIDMTVSAIAAALRPDTDTVTSDDSYYFNWK